MNPQLLTDAAAAVAAVVLILGVLKPLLDNLPAVANLPASTYNAFYQLLGFVLCLGVLLGLQASHGAFDLGGRWYYYVAAAFMAEIGSHVTYSKVKASILAAMDTGAGQTALGVISPAAAGTSFALSTPFVAPAALAPIAPVAGASNEPHSGASMAPAPVAPAVVNPAPVNAAVLSTPFAFAPPATANPAAASVSVAAPVVVAPDAGSAPAALS